MKLQIILAPALLVAAFAGCLEQADLPDPKDATDTIQDLLGGPALWNDPQNAPHTVYGWPTLSNPAVNATAWWKPIPAAELPKHITGLEHVAKSDATVKAGSGIAIFGSLAVVPQDAKEVYVVDISDPVHPKTLSTFGSDGRGAAIIAYPTGRLITVLAGTKTITVADITDPLNPAVLDPIKVNSHKLGVVPGTPILYNAGSSGGEPLPNPVYAPGLCNISIDQCTGITEIYDLSNPEAVVKVQDFKNGLACHHIFFWNNAEKQRAICAGLQYTQLWDTKDPLHPTVIVSIPVHHGVPGTPSAMVTIADFSHSAGINQKGNILYVGDENMGGSLPPGCVAGADTPMGAASMPVGATWFYDISDEKNPKVKGYFAPSRLDDPTIRSCTTHHGRIVPDLEGRDLLAMSYYNEGVILLDFSNPTMPKVVDQWKDGSDTWETWYDQGYLFTGDLNRGLDVITFK